MAGASASTASTASREAEIVVPLVVTTFVAFTLTSLRLYVRKFLIRQLDWDDLHNVLGMLFMIAVLLLTLSAVPLGFGRHFSVVDHHLASRGIMFLRISEFCLIMSTVFVKISIALLLKKLFLRTRNWGIALWAFIIFNSSCSIFDAIVIFPQCTPVAYNWDKSIPGGTCWPDSVINFIGISQGVLAAATDIILASLPLLFLWNISLLWRVKLGVWAIMALGFAYVCPNQPTTHETPPLTSPRSGGFAIARTILVPNLTATKDPTCTFPTPHQTPSNHLQGISYHSSCGPCISLPPKKSITPHPLTPLASFESNFCVMAAALPSIRPLLGGIRSRVAGYSNGRNTPSGVYSGSGRARKSWKPKDGSAAAAANARAAHDVDAESNESNSSQINLWPIRGGDPGIVKTTHLDIRTQPNHGADLEQQRQDAWNDEI
ncbi:hypothetical protein K470DRAFT_281621 [Piedraia hortae CBS 480.64]|uniref:Rhodopsin domain-containing protein n=1 Tax=Piedraia hortae CBS 480.64 TaxID=1314780 RepID=A0A6A7C336_9PEZI|nr:hypothetical protein K470DRAFT_281621 [Piedraia hortae CBS 480.64]